MDEGVQHGQCVVFLELNGELDGGRYVVDVVGEFLDVLFLDDDVFD